MVICTLQTVTSQRMWLMQTMTNVSLFMRHDRAVLIFLFVHCRLLFDPGVCSGQQTGRHLPRTDALYRDSVLGPFVVLDMARVQHCDSRCRHQLHDRSLAPGFT